MVTGRPSAPGSLLWWTARDLASAIRRRELSAREVVGWHLDRIAAVNPRINAVVSLRPEEALAEADAADHRAAAGEPVGPLHGLPIAIKDLEDTAGIRTTYGSTMFADHVPAVDGLLVQRLRAAGAIVVGKTNTPEFGVGSHTFNEVFGPTRNPWALDRSAGGSSGGAAAALAAGLLPIADGSDHGGSIRNPASFNNVVGLRPTPGLVPSSGAGDGWDPASVLGPMARTVGDLALMLAAISGPDPRSPLSFGDPAEFRSDLRGELAGVRIAWCPDLGGLPIEPAVLRRARPGPRPADRSRVLRRGRSARPESRRRSVRDAAGVGIRTSVRRQPAGVARDREGHRSSGTSSAVSRSTVRRSRER